MFDQVTPYVKLVRLYKALLSEALSFSQVFEQII